MFLQNRPNILAESKMFLAELFIFTNAQKMTLSEQKTDISVHYFAFLVKKGVYGSLQGTFFTMKGQKQHCL